MLISVVFVVLNNWIYLFISVGCVGNESQLSKFLQACLQSNKNFLETQT